MACNQCILGWAGSCCWQRGLQQWLLLLLQNIAPIAVIGRLHYAPLTDLAWSPDGAFLAISSQDNYCRWAVSRILPRACTNGQDPQASCLAP